MHGVGRLFCSYYQAKAGFSTNSLLRLLYQTPEPLQLAIASGELASSAASQQLVDDERSCGLESFAHTRLLAIFGSR
jgi:hypothetical protein